MAPPTCEVDQKPEAHEDDAVLGCVKAEHQGRRGKKQKPHSKTGRTAPRSYRQARHGTASGRSREKRLGKQEDCAERKDAHIPPHHVNQQQKTPTA